MTDDREYWRERFEQLEDAQTQYAMEYQSDLAETYIEAFQKIEKDISTWYQRFAANNEISLAEAKRLLKTDELREFKWTVEDYIEHGKRNAVNQLWIKQLENASTRVHISRLESLQLQLRHHVEMLYGGQLDGMEKLMKEIYQEQYYQTAFEIQKAFEVGFSLTALDDEILSKVISKPWTADNMTFSARIWRDKNLLIDTLHKELTHSFVRGEGPQRLISVIQQKMNASRSNAARLVQTEQSFFSSAAQKEVFKELYVAKYEVVATLDFKTSDICQSMDGKIFKMSDYEPGVTANPFHPRCRTTTAPYFEDDDYGQRIARDIDGRTYYVPSNMTYKEWYRQQVETHGKDKLALETKKQRNVSRDKEQYSKYKELLGKNAPKSFEDFQSLKYTNDSEWNRLQDNYYVKTRLNNGTFGSLINPEKQEPHMELTRKEGKSYFYDSVDVQKIFDKYAGTGVIERDGQGRRKNTEKIRISENIGIAVSLNGTRQANFIKIHHSKKRTHIVPIWKDE